MPTEVLTCSDSKAYEGIVAKAAALLTAGELVAIPTETVYGVAARADSADAISALKRVKGRDASKPFSLHIAGPDDVHRYVPELSQVAKRIIRRAWPGPLSVVFPVESPQDAQIVSELGPEVVNLLYHERTIGVRCPDHRVAIDVLSRVPHPVVAASANRAGQPPPRDIEGVLAELDGDLALAIDGGTTQFEGPSTVVRLDKNGFEVLREGVVSPRVLKKYMTVNLLFVCSGNTCRSPMAEALCRFEIAKAQGCSVDELADRGIFVWSAGAEFVWWWTGIRWGGSGGEGTGADLSGHYCAQSLDQALINTADHVFCMTSGHLEAVKSMVPDVGDKVQLLIEGRRQRPVWRIGGRIQTVCVGDSRCGPTTVEGNNAMKISISSDHRGYRAQAAHRRDAAKCPAQGGGLRVRQRRKLRLSRHGQDCRRSCFEG
ncbi:MAG: L-threonylcarbamoyladenylate synthase [Phycisphaerae bacterium]